MFNEVGIGREITGHKMISMRRMATILLKAVGT